MYKKCPLSGRLFFDVETDCEYLTGQDYFLIMGKTLRESGNETTIKNDNCG